MDEPHLSEDLIKQLSEWLVEAEENSIYEPNAFVLSTINADNTPSSITVLLKGVDDEGFVFLPTLVLAKVEPSTTIQTLALCLVGIRCIGRR